MQIGASVRFDCAGALSSFTEMTICRHGHCKGNSRRRGLLCILPEFTSVFVPRTPLMHCFGPALLQRKRELKKCDSQASRAKHCAGT